APSRRSRWAFITHLPSLLAPDQAVSGAASRLGSIANGEQLLGVGAGPATGAHPFGKQTGRPTTESAEVRSVHLALHNTNLNPLVEGPALMLAPVHGKVRRAGYSKTAVP